MTQYISAAVELTRRDPQWFEKLSAAERFVWATTWDLWFRPEQSVPERNFRTCGYDGGRGWGKSLSLGVYVNWLVEQGLAPLIGLMAPTEDRVEEVQIRALIETAKPWNKPEPWKGGLRWPNGTVAQVFTPEAPERTRSGNFYLFWCCEIVDWKHTTRMAAWENLSTATRRGRAQIIWDSTSKGRNDVLEKIRTNNAEDPEQHVIIGGTTFQNPLLSRQYLRDQWKLYAGVRREEELFGRHFSEAQGALWKQAWLDAHRVDLAPTLVVRMVAVDPAQSTHSSSDETGIMCGGTGADGDVYVTHDRSGKYAPEEWGDLVLSELPDGGRVTIERNHMGDMACALLRARADAMPEEVRLSVRTIGRDDPWPEAEAGVVFVREKISRESKGTRADAPAAVTEAGRVHIVGELPELEMEMTTYVPGQRRSPNRLDAAAFLISELLDLEREPDEESTAEDVQAAVAAGVRLAVMIPKPAQAGRHSFSRPRLGL